MRKRLRVILWAALVLAVGALGGAGVARTAPKLADVMPKLASRSGEYTFAQQPGSPGKVTFSHASHVDAARPDCTVCHPGRFKILEQGQTTDGRPIRHKVMEAGGQCGTCHDGKAAFGLKDCETCHSGT